MKRLRAVLMLILLGAATPAAAQIPAEWQAADAGRDRRGWSATRPWPPSRGPERS